MTDQRIAELEVEIARLRDVKAIVHRNQDLDQENERLRDELRRVDGAMIAARGALKDIQRERSHGATANSEYIDRRIVEGLGEGRA